MPAAKPKDITSTVRVGSVSPQTGSGTTMPGKAGNVVQLRAVATDEYVANARYLAGNVLRTLPHAIDDLTSELSDDIYERMQRDGQIAAIMRLLKSAILSEGVSLASPVADEAEADFKQAQEIKDFCTEVMANLTTPIEDVLRNLLDALTMGSKVAEQIYALRENQLVLTALKVKPRRSTAFLVDPFNNVIGLLGQRPGQAIGIIPSAVSSDPKDIPNILPREKFAVLTHEPQDGDPRGRSVLRPAYGAWNLKVQALLSYQRYLAQFATPSVVATVGESAQDVPVATSTGTVMMTAQEYLGTAVAGFQNGSYIVLPFGATLTAIQPQAGTGGDVYLAAFEFFNSEMAKAVIVQTLAINEGKHASRAQAAVHQDILGQIILEYKEWVCRMLRRDILTPLVRYNFANADHLVPTASLGAVEAQDVNAMIQAFSSVGYTLSPSQLPEADRMLGMGARSEGDLIQLQQRAAQPSVMTQPGAQDGPQQPPPAQRAPDGQKETNP
jgi:hypothetical protein